MHWPKHNCTGTHLSGGIMMNTLVSHWLPLLVSTVVASTARLILTTLLRLLTHSDNNSPKVVKLWALKVGISGVAISKPWVWINGNFKVYTTFNKLLLLKTHQFLQAQKWVGTRMPNGQLSRVPELARELMDPMQLLGWPLGTSAASQTFLHTWGSYLHSTSTSFFCFFLSPRGFILHQSTEMALERVASEVTWRHFLSRDCNLMRVTAL